MGWVDISLRAAHDLLESAGLLRTPCPGDAEDLVYLGAGGGTTMTEDQRRRCLAPSARAPVWLSRPRALRQFVQRFQLVKRLLTKLVCAVFQNP